MKSETREKVDFLYSGSNNNTTMTKKEVEVVIDEVGMEIIVNGRLRSFVFKKIFDSRYKVSTEPFTKS